MKILFFLFLLLLLSSFTSAQSRKLVVGDNIKVITTTDIELKPGSSGSINLLDTSKVYLFKPTNGATTLNYSVPGGSTPTPVPTVFVQAESGAITGAQKDPSTGGTTVCCITPGALLQYPTVLAGQTKLTVKYSRGSSGNGQVFLQIGAPDAIPISLSLPSTGSWTVFKDVTFTFPAKTGTGVWIRSTTTGPMNPDSFTWTP